MRSAWLVSSIELVGAFFKRDRKTIMAWLADGAPQKTSRGYDLSEWAQWRDRRRPADVVDLEQRLKAANVHIKEAEAEIKQAKAGKTSGELIDRREVVRQNVERGRRLRTIMQRWRDELPPLLLGRELKDIRVTIETRADAALLSYIAAQPGTNGD